MGSASFNRGRKKRRLFHEVFRLIEDDKLCSEIKIYLSTKVAGDDFDSYENNYTDQLLNPILVKGYVREISPEALVWKQYGLSNIGTKEILCRRKYRNYFETCAKIEVDGEEYQVFKEGTGGKTIISERPGELIRVVITRKD